VGRSVAPPTWVKYFVSRAFFIFWFVGSRTGRTERRTDMLNGSNDAVSRKEVPFGGLVSLRKRKGGQTPRRHQNRTCKGEIPAKTKKANNL
jgi:hypothetical protein